MADSNGTAVEVKGLHKIFKLPRERHNGVKQLIINFLKRKRGYEMQHVLNGVSFEIKQGDFFGIVGRNGSGKSTLLKLLAGIYTPNKGVVKVNGTLTPFIELGVGFNPELTGRENVFLNGALLGFGRKEMEEMYDDIVGFAELERFMDQKLKNYSSGMQVRLAFSIAIRANSDILLIDEVLAVGDEAFQKKCFSYFNELKRKKKTVILVTHDMSAVERFCNKAIMIEGGEIKIVGKPHKVAAAYSRSNADNYDIEREAEDVPREFDIAITDSDGEAKRSFEYSEAMTVKLSWNKLGVKNAGVAIFRDNGEYVFGPNTYQDKYSLASDRAVQYTVKLNLNEGDYFVKAGLFGETDLDNIAFIEEGPHFTVKRDYDSGRWGGVTKLDYKWK